MCKNLELVNFSQKIGRKGRGKPTNQFFCIYGVLKGWNPPYRQIPHSRCWPHFSRRRSSLLKIFHLVGNSNGSSTAQRTFLKSFPDSFHFNCAGPEGAERSKSDYLLIVTHSILSMLSTWTHWHEHLPTAISRGGEGLIQSWVGRSCKSSQTPNPEI